VIGAHDLAPKKSTHVTEALRRKEGSHNGITLKLGGGAVGPSAQNNDQVRGARGNAHVLIKGFRESLPRYALSKLRFVHSKECFYTLLMRFNDERCIKRDLGSI